MSITQRAITPDFGVEVTGLDIGFASPSVCRELVDLVLRFGVLVLRLPRLICTNEQVAFARHFGPLEIVGDATRIDAEVVRVRHGPDSPPTENMWHADMSFRSAPPRGAVLRGVVVPETGGDTLFADMRKVRNRLPKRVTDLCRDLSAEHDITKQLVRAASTPAELDRFAQFQPAVHPILRKHPDSGAEVLFVNEAYTTRVIGLDEENSSALLSYLWRQVAIPEVQCRIRWTSATLVVWDNCLVQHYAVGDYLPHERVMERVTLAA